MRLSDEQISQFQQLHKARFGEEISREQALESGAQLVRLMQLVYKPIKKSDLDKLKNSNN